MPFRASRSRGFTAEQIALHKSRESCFVTVGESVYDVAKFLDNHPGGASLILDHAGQDVKSLMQNGDIHQHSDMANRILRKHFVGLKIGPRQGHAVKAAPNKPSQGAEGETNAESTLRSAEESASAYSRYDPLLPLSDTTHATDYRSDQLPWPTKGKQGAGLSEGLSSGEKVHRDLEVEQVCGRAS